MAQFYGFHGLGCSKKYFDCLASSLIVSGHQFAARDFKGFGERANEAPSDNPFEDAVEEALGYTRGSGKISIIAHSMGAVIALKLAEQIPDRIHQMVIIEGNLTPHDGGAVSKRINIAAGQEGGVEPTETVAAIKADLLESLPNSEHAGLRYWAEDLQNVDPKTLEIYGTKLVEVSRSGEMMKIFQGLQCQRLYIHGDGYVGHKTLDEMGSIPTMHIEGASHFPLIEQPNMCALEILTNGQYAVSGPMPPDSTP